MTEPSQTPSPLLDAASVEDVFKAAEEVRISSFPDLPASLLSAVLSAEHDNLDDRAAASRAVDHAVENYLSTEVHHGGDDAK